MHDLNSFLFFLVLENILSIWLIQNMRIVKFYHALVYRKIISLYPQLFFKNQSHNFKYVHITSKTLHSGSQGREIISGGFVTVPFSQSLTLDLGTVASPSRFNLLWVWHDHVSGELVKAHSLHRPGPSSVLLWWLLKTCCTLSGINSEWYRQMIPDPVCALLVWNYPIKKLGSNWNWQSEVIPDQHFISGGYSSF